MVRFLEVLGVLGVFLMIGFIVWILAAAAAGKL